MLLEPYRLANTSIRYKQLLGCEDFDSDNTTALYARYTTSVLCNAIIQNSAEPCGLEGDATRPLCADSCAEYAQSEQEIAASSACGNSNSDALTQIRADFTNCALPANSLSGQCISAVENQPDDCGFSSNLGSLCIYCSSSSPNATDSCCVFSDTEQRCENVVLPVVASSSLSQIVTTLTTGSGSPTSEPEATAEAARRGLTGGQIAGIVIGAVLGALALLALIIFGCLLLRKRRSNSPATSVFNQPATMKQIPPPSGYTDGPGDNKERAGPSFLGGGRVARMSALEHSGSPTPDDEHSPILATGAAGRSSSDDESHGARRRMVPPQTGTRNGSLSSTSQLTPGGATAISAKTPGSGPGAFDTSSPETWTSPESGGQSEQLAFFKDYYSSDEIHPTDIVAALWAYEPRAADEFHLERGDMVKVVGIWDDGWATGTRARGKAEDWKANVQRDSGMTESQPHNDGEGEVKAFPLVCVCLPQHWRKTIEGESTEETSGY
jgi:hypothetical protein